MKINCICCGFKVDLDDAYDDFEGQIKCFVCGTLLDIKTQEGCIRSVRIANFVPISPAGDNFCSKS